MTTHAMQGVAGLVCVSVVDQVIRASQPVISAAAFNEQRLPTDPIGTTTVTLTNLVSGSAIRIEEADGTLREYRDADATSEAFALQVYSAGSAKNNLVIKVRKGTTSPKYLPYITYVTAAVGAQSVYIAQVADTIAA